MFDVDCTLAKMCIESFTIAYDNKPVLDLTALEMSTLIGVVDMFTYFVDTTSNCIAAVIGAVGVAETG